MKNRYLVLVLVPIALAFPSLASGQGSTLPETFTVDATSAQPQFTKTVFEADKSYTIVATGTSSVWSDKQNVIDALYCFASSRCSDRGTIPVRFPKLQFNDMGIDEFSDLVEVRYLPRTADVSTTDIIHEIRNRLID